MDALTRLTAIEDIKRLKARYYRCMDMKDWNGVAAVFAPDAIFDVRYADSVWNAVARTWSPPPLGEEQVVRGEKAIVTMMRERVGNLSTIHHGHMPEIDFLSDTMARGVWTMEDLINTEDHRLILHGYGLYYDTYERLASGWVIKTTRLERLQLVAGEAAVGH